MPRQGAIAERALPSARKMAGRGLRFRHNVVKNESMAQPSPQKLKQAFTRGQERGRWLSSSGGGGASYQHDMARAIAKELGWTKEDVVRKIAAYHRERLDAVPDLRQYPELDGERELLLEYYRGIKDAGLDDDSVALCESLGFWRDVRLFQETGRGMFVFPMPEKCRVLYVPRSDQGQLHAKNVDDPITYWKGEKPVPPGSPWPFSHPLVFDGVGSGLHLDEIPPEIFPVNPIELCREHCATVKEATAFLVRYNYFWSGQNLLVHDHHGNSVAFEKTRCRVAIRGPNAQGINFITGMGALDPGIRAFQNAQRSKYLEQIGAGQDDVDACFWKLCQGQWDNMKRYVEELSKNPTAEGALALMAKRDPGGPMCLTGKKCHPDEKTPGYTLLMRMYFMDQKKMHRRLWRGKTPSYKDTPEIVQYS